MPTTAPNLIYDAHASENNIYSSTNSNLWCGSNSAVVNAQIAILFDNVQVEQSEKVTEALLSITAFKDLGSSSLIVAIGAQKTANASQPSGGSDILGRTMTTARLSYTFTGTTAKMYTFDLAPVIQEIVNQASWQPGNDLLVQIRPTGGTGAGNTASNGGRRLDFYSAESATPPTLSITTAQQAVTAQMSSGDTITDRTAMVVSAEAPEPPPTIVAQMVAGDTITDRTVMQAGRGDPIKHTLQRVERLPADTHAFVTERGELLPFAARFDETLGGVRSEMLGSQDDAWYPASGLLNRTPEALAFRAYLPDRDDPERAGDRFVRLLPDVRQLVLPGGHVWGLHSAQKTARPSDEVIDLVVGTTGAYPKHPLLSGTIQAAFETFGSEPELPIYAIDTAGGITAPLSAASWDTGAVAFGVRIAERTRQSIVALGTPIAADGTVPDGSLAVSWDGAALLTHLRGRDFRLREQFLGPFGAVLVGVLRWTKHSATLTTCSALGLRTWELPIGPVQPLSEQTVSAGRRADGVGSGAFIAFGKPFLSIWPGTASRAERIAQQLYTELTVPNLSWEIKPPEYAVTLSRADDKGLELAPGESVTFDLAATRTGYTGNLELAITADTLTSSYTVTRSGDTDTYHVTLSAPAGTPEAAYTLRVEAEAAGADNEGSLLKDVRDSFDAVVQVAAGPAIAPNATALYFANDPVQKRDAQMLVDASGNGNTLFWEGYARPNREFTALLATGVYGAHVRSGALANAAQAQRMNGNQTHSLILGEIDKSKDGTLYHARAGGGDNGVLVLKSGNGFKLQTVNGANTVTSPDTLTWRGGRARLILVIDTGGITLLDRDAGSSISLARPAWPDDGVKVHLGATRANSGAVSNLTRVYCYVWSIHPYALSDIARRRNMDALQVYAPKTDGKGEFPDNAFGVLLFDAAGNLLRNYGAPALNLTLQADGSYSAVTGRGVKVVSGSGLFMNTGVSSSETVSYMTTVLDFNQTSDYNAVTALDDSTNTVVSASVTKHASGSKLFPMQRKSNGQYDYGTFGPNQGAGKLTFLSRVSEKGRKHFVKEFVKGESRTIDGDMDWPGQFVFSIGGAKRPDGSYFQRTTTTNLSTVLVRGEFTSDDQITTRALLEG